MKKAMGTCKKALSVILTIAMLLTTLVFFNISAVAENNSVITVTDNGEADQIYLYVPEQIYLKPTLTVYQAQQAYAFEWFVDEEVDTTTHQATLRTGENATGNFYFYYEHATEIQISYKYLDENLNDMTAYTTLNNTPTDRDYANPNAALKFAGASNTISPYNTRSNAQNTKQVFSNTNEVNTQIVTADSQSPVLLASTKGCYIEWMVRFNDTREVDAQGNPVVKTTKAYTYLYKPYITPVGNAQRTKNPQGEASFGQDVTWISGVHGVVNQGSYYANSGTSYGLVTFSNNDTSGTLVPTANFAGSAGSLYALFPQNFYSSGWDDKRADSWINAETSTYFTDKTFNYHDNSQGASGVVWNDNAFYNVCNAPTAKITVDASRYGNFNVIPNFTAGMLMADNQGAKADGAYYIADATGRTTEADQDNREKDKTDRGENYWNNVNASYVSVIKGTYASTASEAVSDGVKVNTRYNRPLTVPTAGTVDTQNYKVKMAYFNKDSADGDHYGGDTIWNFSIIPIQATVFNKSALRSAMLRVYQKFAKLSVLEDGSSRYYDDQSSEYLHFIAIFKACGQLLAGLDRQNVTVDGVTYTMSSIVDEVDNVLSNIENTRKSSSATVRMVAVADGKAQNVVDTATQQTIADETADYNYNDTVTVTAPVFAGYKFLGYSKSLKNVGDNVAASDITEGNPAPDAYAFTDNITYTLFYEATALTVTVDTNGGINNLLKIETGTLPTAYGGVAFPVYTASEATDFNYSIDENDVKVWFDGEAAGQKYQLLPFCADLEAGKSYTLSYDLIGAAASDVKFTFVGDGVNQTVSSNGTFTASASGRAYLKLQLLNNALSGKEFKIKNLCLTAADSNALYLETSTAYPQTFTGSTIKTDMNYNVTGSNSVQVSARYSTVQYSQKQLLPFYVDILSGYTYQFSYNLSGIDQSNVIVTFVGAGGTVYTPDEDGMIAATADDKIQLKVEFTTATNTTVGTFTNLRVDKLDTKTVIEGKSNDTLTLGIPVNEGYSFAGWSITGDDTASANGTLTSFKNTLVNDYRFGVASDTLTAIWNLDEYCEVVFRNTDGTVLSTQNVKKGTAASAPTEDPSLFGHTFTGWDKDFSNVQDDMYIEPVFDEIDITVTLNKTALTMYAGHSDNTVTATLSPDIEGIGDVQWKSSNSSYVTVTGSGAQNRTATITGVKAGTARITASVVFDGRTYTTAQYVNVTVQALKPTAIEITKDPDKTSYFVGDTFDPTGLQVKVTYNDGSQATVDYPDSRITLSTINTSTAGNKTLTVSFKEGSATAVKATTRITVTRVTLESIAVTTPPTNTQYYVGDTELDTTGIVVTAYYNNGTTETLGEDDVTFSALNASTVGTKEITVTYSGKTDAFNVTVNALELISIAVKDMPKTEYFVGDNADYTGLTLTATYNNGTTADITTGYTTSGFSSATAGQKTITVSYGGKTTTYNVNVAAVELTSIAVKDMPKTNYFVGDSADYTGLTLTATYNNGATETVTTGYTTSGFSSAAAGQKTITVSYGGKTTTYTVNVTAIELVSIAVKTEPAKTAYFVGEDADYTGLVITATYNNGTTADVTTGYTTSGYDSATAGQKTITVTYGGKTATFKMTVNPVELTGIEIVNEPEKKTYLTGDTADFTGLKIKANYNNGTSEELTTGFTTNGFDSETAGQKTITVTYNGKTAQFNVTVNWNLANYDEVDAAIETVPADMSIYTDESVAAVTTAVNNVVRGKTVAEQAAVDAMAAAINTAVAGLTEKPLNTAEYEAAQNSEHKDFDLCTDTSVAAVTNAKQAADTFLANNNKITKQAEFDTLVNAYKTALANLAYKPANYEEVDALLELLDTLNPDWFENWDDIYWTYICDYAGDYIPANHDYTVDRQADVYEMADTLQGYINMLELKPADYSAITALQNELAAKKTSGLYTDESIAEAESYFDALDWTLKIVEQADVDSAVPTLRDVVDTVPVLKDADYTAVNAKVAYINYLADNWGVDEDGTEYVNFDEIYWDYMIDYIDTGIDYTLKADKQDDVDAMAAQLQEYIDMLQTAAPTAELVSIAVKTAPAKTAYTVGDTADYTGLVIEAAYSDNTTAIVTADCALSGFDSTTAGTKTITATYEGKTATFNVTVEEAVVEYFNWTDTAEVKEDGDTTYVYGFQTGMTEKSFKSTFTEYEGVTVTVEKSSSRYVGTGSKVIVEYSSGKVDEYIVIIYGDLDGNSKVDATDAELLMASLSGDADPLEGEFKLAADVYGTGRKTTLNDMDYAAILNVASGELELDQVSGKVIEAE